MQTTSNEIAGPHLDYFNDLYNKLNPMGHDELDAASIAAFLKTARGIQLAQLSQIWEVASELSGCQNRAALNRPGVYMCFKLVAAAQQGLPLSAQVLTNPTLGPPLFEGQQPPPVSATRQPPPFGSKSPSIASELGNQAELGCAISGEEQRKYEAIFDSLGPFGGRLNGDQCRPVLLNSQLPKTVLAKIWDLADMDGDGHLDRPEFCVAIHLVYRALQNEPIPERLPPSLVPISKRHLLRQMAVRSTEPSGHPPPLTWSSRASSVASLNYFPQPMSPQNFAHPPQQPQQQQPPQQNIPIPAARPSSLFDRNMDDWQVDSQLMGQYEAEFAGLDRDGDGLVSGTDVRDVFLRSGLAQQVLARIWAHVDTQRTGRLNLEQYIKCVLLIRECQEAEPGMAGAGGGNVSPSPLPPPPATLGRRDSQISTNSSTGTAKQPPSLADNPRVQELSAAIEEVQANRRKADQDLFQAEADLKVKNSEVKNLEIELLTLEATVKQLRNQRVEANKRLNDLDTRIAKLETLCTENQRRVEEEEARLGRTKLEIQQARENSEAEASVLEQLRAEAQTKREQLARTRERLSAKIAKFEGFVDELTQLERGIVHQEEEASKLRDQMTQMQRILEGVDRAHTRDFHHKTSHVIISYEPSVSQISRRGC